MMRVLLTGTTGFIGSHVARLLVEQGAEVHGVVLPGEPTVRIADILGKINQVPLDLRDRQQVRDAVSAIKPDCAVHLAWYAVPGKYWTAPDNLDCVTMSLSLTQALSEVGCRKLVAAGSCAEYDWNYGYLSETLTPLHPTTLYGICKDATRRILQEFCVQNSMAFAWARFFFLYGPGEPRERLVPSVATSLLAGREALCTDGVQIRDFLHVRDLASAVIRLLGDDAHGAFNIGSGVPVAVKDVIQAVAANVGRPDLVRLGARQGAPEMPLVVAAMGRLRGELGWQPQFDLETGIAQTVAWWRSHDKKQ